MLTFRTEDGAVHSEEVQDRFLWWPSPGDTIHVFEQSPGHWEVEEEFSWLRTIGYLLLTLIPLGFGLLPAARREPL